jgi:cell division cycle protein 37
MVAGDPRALDVFIKDVEDTYAVVAKRAKVTKEEQENQAGVEQIQLVAENPDTVISFDVPDGPPPENLVLEGPGTEDLDIEEVRKSLQTRWVIFNNFDEKFKKALISNDLEKVNKVLGKMPVAKAEQLVGLLQVAGILNFAEGGIRDETGKQTEVAPAA